MKDLCSVLYPHDMLTYKIQKRKSIHVQMAKKLKDYDISNSSNWTVDIIEEENKVTRLNMRLIG